VEAIQNCYRVVDLSLKNIYIKERESRSTRAKFQEDILLVPKDDVSDVPRLSLSEKTRGDIILKAWETNMVERKRLAREVNEAFLEALSSLDKGLLDVEGNIIFETLGQIDIAKNQYNSRTSKEESQMTIQQMNQIDLIQINKWIVNPSLQLQVTSIGAKGIQENLPQVERKLYIFEANEATKPFGLVVQLVNKCIQCVEYGKASISGNK
jgi:hypothetical protein